MTGDRRSVRLLAKLDVVMPGVLRTAGQLWEHPQAADVYRSWLVTLHQMVRATVPLMLTAVTECFAREDETAAAVGGYLARHIRDEYGHDRWLAEDHARSSGDIAELSAPPGAAVAELVGAQYYWIRHGHPVALLGHIAVLEGYPPSPDLGSFLAARTGLPRDAFSTIDRHATLDVRHRDELLRVIDATPMTPHLEQLVGVSALHTARAMHDVVRGVLRRADALPVTPVPGSAAKSTR